MPVNRDEIVLAEPLLREIQAMLEVEGGIYCRGAAMLNRMLTDGGSLLFAPFYEGALRDALEIVVAALQGARKPDRGRE